MHFEKVNGPASTNWALLGGVRFILALIVAAVHVPYFFTGPDHHSVIAVFQRFSGFSAVLSFLILSGYSIAASFARDPGGFYFRRALRVVPQYVLILVGSAIMPLFFGGTMKSMTEPVHAPSYTHLASNLCFAQGFLTTSLETNPVVWTLSLEVFFYALTPWIAARTNAQLWKLILASGVCYAGAGLFWPPLHASEVFGLNVPLLGWIWLLGYWLYRENGNERSWLWALVLGLTVFPLNYTNTNFVWFHLTWLFTLAALRFGHRLKLGNRPQKLLLFLGDISYPLYLIHVPCFMLLFALGWKHASWFIPVSIAGAAFSEIAFDRPIKRMVLALLKNKAAGKNPVTARSLQSRTA